jgi:hypothetical protein
MDLGLKIERILLAATIGTGPVSFDPPAPYTAPGESTALAPKLLKGQYKVTHGVPPVRMNNCPKLSALIVQAIFVAESKTMQSHYKSRTKTTAATGSLG